MNYIQNEQDLEPLLKEWSMHWDADRFLREALIKAFYSGRDSMWQEMRALQKAIVEKESGFQPVAKGEKE